MKQNGMGLSTPRSRGFVRMIGKMLRRPQFWFGFVTLVPLFAWYSVISFWSVIQAFRIALIHYRLIGTGRFVGLDNFRELFSDPLFTTSLKNSAEWGVIGIFVGIPLALTIALCLVNVTHGRNLFQSLIFVPVVVPIVSTILIAKYLLDPAVGPIDALLQFVHLPQSGFLTDGNAALPTAALFGSWKGLGITIVILTAGLLNIPTEVNDAARIDGANEWGRFRYITLPLVQPTLNLVVILGVIGALQEFTIPQVLTGGGPANATMTINLYIYNLAFQNFQFSQASAAALVEFAITMVLTLGTLRLTRMSWSY
ncbi:MAG TPA: sugar ABC transporter permease [Chloroflexota bacterium]